MELIKSKLKKRLRKKFHLGEFQELGFEICANLNSELSEMEFDRFYDEFIDLIEENKLLFGGGVCKQNMEGFVTSAKKFASPTSQDKEKIKDWFERRDEVFDSNVGKFKDAWND